MNACKDCRHCIDFQQYSGCKKYPLTSWSAYDGKNVIKGYQNIIDLRADETRCGYTGKLFEAKWQISDILDSILDAFVNLVIRWYFKRHKDELIK